VHRCKTIFLEKGAGKNDEIAVTLAGGSICEEKRGVRPSRKVMPISGGQKKKKGAGLIEEKWMATRFKGKKNDEGGRKPNRMQTSGDNAAKGGATPLSTRLKSKRGERMVPPLFKGG